MNDEKLLRIMELFDAECLYQDTMTGSGRAASLKRCQRKTDIYLKSLDNETLNDFVVMVKVGKYDEHRKNDLAWNEVRKKSSIDNLTAWSKLIGATELSDNECIKYLRSWSAMTILNDLHSYLIMEPVPAKHKALLRKRDENKINKWLKHKRIEMR